MTHPANFSKAGRGSFHDVVFDCSSCSMFNRLAGPSAACLGQAEHSKYMLYKDKERAQKVLSSYLHELISSCALSGAFSVMTERMLRFYFPAASWRTVFLTS